MLRLPPGPVNRRDSDYRAGSPGRLGVGESESESLPSLRVRGSGLPYAGIMILSTRPAVTVAAACDSELERLTVSGWQIDSTAAAEAALAGGGRPQICSTEGSDPGHGGAAAGGCGNLNLK